MNMDNCLNEYFKHNKRLIPLNGKIPLTNNWVNSNFTKKELKVYKGNYGWALNETDLVVDVDPRSNGLASFNKLCKTLKINLTKSVITPSEGFHCYLRIPAGYKITKNNKAYPGIDFLSHGAQVVIAGSKIASKYYIFADELFGGFIQEPCPPILLSFAGISNNISNIEDDNDLSFADVNNASNLTASEIIEMLDLLNPSCGYNEWFEIGMALNSWSPTEGLAIWEGWSKKGDTYKKGECAKKWDSFKPNGPITIASLVYKHKDAIKTQMRFEVNDLITKISQAERNELESIMDKLPRQDITDEDREIIQKKIQNRFKDLSGEKLSIATIRKRTAKYISNISNAPYWCHDWVFDKCNNEYHNIKTSTAVNEKVFNLLCGKFIPENEGGGKPNAAKYVADNGFVEVVNQSMYAPDKEKIFEYNGIQTLNLYDSSTCPETAEVFTKAGLIGIEKIKKHIQAIFDKDKCTEHFINWLATVCQHPGRLFKWAPLLVGIEGIGKTFISELVGTVIGKQNTNTIFPSQVVSSFNAWAHGYQVGFLEELHVSGHNRMESMNAIKALITNSVIEVTSKGRDPKNVRNTMNYFATTNHENALLLTETDRRWLIINPGYRSLKEFEEVIGKKTNEWFTALHGVLLNYGSELRKWLLEHPIPVEFLNINCAPMTMAKAIMIETENMYTDGFDDIKILIDNENIYYNQYYIVPRALFEEYQACYNITALSPVNKGRLLKKLGYKYAERLNINGQQERVFTAITLTKNELKSVINAYECDEPMRSKILQRLDINIL